MWLLLVCGFLLPLIPFFIGQITNGFADITAAYTYINQSGSGRKVFILKSILDRLSFPFAIFFPADNFSWFLKFLVTPFYLFILCNVFFIAFLKTHFRLLTRIVLVLFFSTVIQSMLMKVPFYFHYNYSAAILTIVLISIYISYLYHFAKIKFLWLPVFAIFILWEILLTPYYYKNNRSPKVVSEVSKIILADYNSRLKDPLVGIFVISPATLSSGFEYRYSLEKEGIKTFSASRAAAADYVVLEGLLPDRMSFEVQESDRRVFPVKEFKFDDGGKIVKYAKLIRVEKIN